MLCGNKNPNKLKRSIVVGQEITQAGAELVEKEGGEGKKRNIFLSLCRDVNSQTGYISSYTENISFLVGRNENKSLKFRHHRVEKYENFTVFIFVRSPRNANPFSSVCLILCWFLFKEHSENI